jgi:hypothetical protein
MKKPDVTILNPARRSFLKTSAAGTVLAGSSGLLEIALGQKDAAAFAYSRITVMTDYRRHIMRPQLRLASHVGGAQEGQCHCSTFFR